jgi:hypothetical protein
MATATTSPTATIAKELASLVREGRNREAIERLYSPAIVSIEPVGDEQTPAVVTGIDAVRGKNEWWVENHEVHETRADGPLVGEDQFAMHYEFDVTQKATGQRFKMAEMALYTVHDDKIVREEFFYNVPGK